MTERRILKGADIVPWLDDFAALRIRVFREWPYLYDGDLDYERRYAQSYVSSENAVIAAVIDGGRMVGASTGLPIEDHEDGFASSFENRPEKPEELYYCAESVLDAAYRGQGFGNWFFDVREAEARRLQRRYSTFCAVLRDPAHPMRPKAARALAPFWRKRGYRELPDVETRFPWTDLGEEAETDKVLRFWIKDLCADGGDTIG
ncbi:MAG: GNAT family N-acetyltransferase [Pseudomonadota bacterium]